jgi:hypothetical protein
LEFSRSTHRIHPNALESSEEGHSLRGGVDKSIRGFTDSDWGSQPDRYLISGYAFLVGTGAVTWRSKKQSIVALSTTEAEYDQRDKGSSLDLPYPQ